MVLLHRLISKPAEAVLNTCTDLFKSLNNTTSSYFYKPLTDPKLAITFKLEDNTKDVDQPTIEKPLKKDQREQPKSTPFCAATPLQQQRYNRLRVHFRSQEVDMLYRRAFEPTKSTKFGTVKSKPLEPIIIDQLPTNQLSFKPRDTIEDDLLGPGVLVEVY